MLKEGTIVDATIIEVPSSIKNREGKRDPEMHQTKKGNGWHFGITRAMNLLMIKKTRWVRVIAI